MFSKNPKNQKGPNAASNPLYPFNRMGNLAHNILVLPPKEMQLCKQLLFPEGFCVDENKNVYTPKISPLYRLKSIKKDSDESSDSPLVRMKRL